MAFSDRGAPPSPSSLCSTPREVGFPQIPALLLPWRDAGCPAAGTHHALCSTFSLPAVGTGWGFKTRATPRGWGHSCHSEPYAGANTLIRKAKVSHPKYGKPKGMGAPGEKLGAINCTPKLWRVEDVGEGKEEGD